MITFHCENWTPVVFALLFASLAAYVWSRTLRTGRFTRRHSRTPVHHKRQPKDFAITVVVGLALSLFMTYVLASQAIDRCAGV